jgi:hypothetical protein
MVELMDNNNNNNIINNKQLTIIIKLYYNTLSKYDHIISLWHDYNYRSRYKTYNRHSLDQTHVSRYRL